MSKDQTSMSEELFKLDGKPSTSQALPLALQHVVAMVVGCVAPAIIISGFSVIKREKTCNWGRITCYHGY